jgi:hypothetical protein
MIVTLTLSVLLHILTDASPWRVASALVLAFLLWASSREV